MNLIFQAFLVLNLFGFTALQHLKIGNNPNVDQKSNMSLEFVGRRSFTPKKDQNLVVNSPHHITKRSSGFDKFVKGFGPGSAIGGKIGSIFGPKGTVIGAAIGGVVGGIICVFFCKEEKPNRPPSFSSCVGPANEEYFADLGTTTTTVTWNTPTASDLEDGSLTAHQVQGGASGTQFGRGSHTIIYTASDRKGATTYCYFSFRITVLTCDPIQWPLHGYVRCDRSEFMYGSKCTVGCFEGYEMEPLPASVPYQIMCDKSSDNKAILDKAVPSCAAITCPTNATELDVDNGSPVCTHSNHKYDSSCVTQCESGYSLSSGIIFSTCQEDKTWSTNLPDCEDDEAPEILNCPQTIYAYTDKMSQTASVTWQTPTATDNSGTVTVSQTKGAAPGSSFQLGLTEIRYKAIDTNGNQSPECIFFVNVEEIVCDPPLIADKYLFYQCPDGYMYGSTCQLKCMGSFPLIGNETITCERNNSFTPPRGYWDMGGLQPYCSKNPCDTLLAPENGAMSCATWMFGMQCQMQCSGQYDIPYGTVGSNGAPFTGQFTCSESLGEYTPSNTVPGCTQLRRPRMTTVLGEFFYYTGDCNDPTVLVEIKNNFIKQMQRLESQGWNGVCPSQIDCNVNNTEVTCGPVIGKRRKRDVSFVLEHVLSKRSTHEIRVEVKLATTWYNFNSTGGSTFYFLEEVQKKLFEVMKSSATAGNLTVSGLSPDISSFALGYSDPDCPVGNIIRWSTLTCVPCSEGSFLDTSDPMNPRCRDCPVGTYKESPDDLTCTSCPPGTSTEKPGSMNTTNCLKKCAPGEFSKTGLEPCHLCLRFFYQSEEMSTSCMSCPFGKTTAYSGATDTTNCSYFDVQFTKAQQQIYFDPPTTDQKQLSLYTWIALPKTMANFSLLRIESSFVKIEFQYHDSLFVQINRQSMSTGVTLPRETWSHVTIQLDSDSQTVVVYVDGTQVFSSSVSGSIPLSSSLTTQSSRMSIMLNEESLSGYIISGYHVEFTTLSDTEVATLSNACHTYRQNAFFSMDTIANLSQVQPTTTFLSPSICDHINQCDSNPCNGHTCVDKVNAYKCQCKDGYSGERCQIEPDYCKNSPCQNNGTCFNSAGNFSCTCQTGYKGDRCQFQIVNGGWSPWTSFSECSASCGGGIKSRLRLCNSPKPDPDGLPCDSTGANETVFCNTDTCPSCLPLKKGFGNSVNCSTFSDGHKVCLVSCRHGYVFSEDHKPLPVYVCGPNTSYTWNGNPPSCGRANSPKSISIVSAVQYTPGIPCVDAVIASSQLKTNLESSLPCSVNGSCSINVSTPGCSVTGRRRRSASSQTITLTQTLTSGDNLDLEAFEKSQNVSQPLYDLLVGISSLEASAIQINSTHSILQFEISGTQYSSTAVTTNSLVECSAGQGRNKAFCIDCPPGTYSESVVCVACSVGTYQDESGQSSCKSCPGGLTTKYEGSQNMTDCSENDNSTTVTSTSPLSSTSSSLSLTSVTKTSTSPSASPFSTSKKQKDNPDVMPIVIGVIAVLTLVLFVAIVGFIVFKKIKRLRFRRLSREHSTLKGSWASLNMVKPNVVRTVPPTSNVYKDLRKSKSILSFSDQPC
nr:sushi, von Willebrand factor type A, EGF and pentraxin domain-containing protein 1-like [Crassostrea gigas]